MLKMQLDSFTHSIDRPFWLSILSIIWIEVVNILPFIDFGARFVIQLSIGVLTVIYLIHKIRNIKKINNQIDKQNDKEK